MGGSQVETQNNQVDNSPLYYQNIDEDIRKRKKAWLTKKVVFSSLLLILSVFIILYFTISSFRFSSLTCSGLYNLQTNDIIAFSKCSESSSLLFIDSQSLTDSTKKNSSSILLNADFNVNPFSASATVIENYPSGILNDVVYCSSGIKSDELIEAVKTNSCLSDESKTRISDSIRNEAEKGAVPEIFLPESLTVDSSTPAEAILPLKGISPAMLDYIKALEYRNKNGDTRWSNVLSLWIEDEKNNLNFVFDNLLYEWVYSFFSSPKRFTENLLPAMEKAAKEGKLSKTELVYPDAEEKVDAYQVGFNNSTGAIVIPK
ncbi:MAG: hypothetical protein WCS80_02535 [Bacilli bacterium]